MTNRRDLGIVTTNDLRVNLQTFLIEPHKTYSSGWLAFHLKLNEEHPSTFPIIRLHASNSLSLSLSPATLIVLRGICGKEELLWGSLNASMHELAWKRYGLAGHTRPLPYFPNSHPNSDLFNLFPILFPLSRVLPCIAIHVNTTG